MNKVQNPAENKDLLIKAEDISKSFSGRQVLRDISLQIFAKEIISVIGPNGGGKSTLVKVLLELIPFDKGNLYRRANLTVAYMAQDTRINKIMPLTVKKVLALSGNENKQDIADVLQLTEISELYNKDFHALSGGQAQRVLLARCLLRRPELLILDEPTQSLDFQGRVHFYRLIKKVRDIYDCAVLIVSHDLHLVMASTDKVICLNHHICCSGHPASLTDNKGYLDLFPETCGNELAVYTHKHNHSHSLAEGGCSCDVCSGKTKVKKRKEHK